MRNSTWLAIFSIITAIFFYSVNNSLDRLVSKLIVALFISAYFICKTIEGKNENNNI